MNPDLKTKSLQQNKNLAVQQPAPIAPTPKPVDNGIDQDAVNLAKAIRQHESGGNFSAVGDAGTSTGAYQFQPATWRAYAKDVLGDPNAPMTRENQNAVAYGKIKEWKDSGLNVAQISAKWNSGSEKGWENKVGTTTINGKQIKYDVPAYVSSVITNYQGLKSQTPKVEPEVTQETPVQKEGFLKGLYSDVIGSTFIKPAVRLGEAAGVSLLGGISKLTGEEVDKQRYERALDIAGQEKQVFGATVSGIKPIDEGGALQIAGEGLQAASNLYTGGGAGSIAKGVFKTPAMKAISNLAVTGGIGGGLYGAGTGLQSEDPTLASVANETGTAIMVGTLLGGGLGVAGVGLAKGLQKVAPKSTNIMQRVAKLTNKQEIKFKQMTGEDVGEFLSKRDLNLAPEEIVQESTQRFINSYQEADNALAQLPGRYKIDPVKTALDDLVQRETAISTPGTKSANSETINALVKKYEEGGLTMPEINQVKRIYEKEVKLPYMKENNSLQVERSGRIDSAIREWQLKKADDLGFKNLREINKQTQAYKFLADKIADRISGAKTNNALSLTDAVLLAGGDPQAIAMFATRRFFGSAKIQALVAKIARDKKLDVGQVKALFGESTGLPAKIPGMDYTPARPTGRETKYKQINLPEQVRATDLGLNEIKNAKQGQRLSQELLSKPYTKDMIKKDASQVMDIVDDLPKEDKAGLLNVLKENNPKVYKEVIETQNQTRYDKYQTVKDLPMSEKVAKDKSYVRPKPNTQSGKISMGADNYDTVAKALMDYDTTPMMVDGKLDLNYTEPDFRLGQLQDKIRKTALNDAEAKEAEKLLQERGALPKINTQAGFISTGNKDLQPLYKEAQKYKSAEEFVKAQGIPAYHGTATKFDKFSKEFSGQNQQNDFGSGISFTDSKDVAKSFANDAGGDIVMETRLNLKKPARNKDLLDPDIQDAIDDEMGFTDLGDVLKEKGFDGIEYTHSDGSKEYVIFDEKQIKTNKELQQIWKEANSKTSTKQGMTAINPLTVGAGVTAVGAGSMSIKNKKDNK